MSALLASHAVLENVACYVCGGTGHSPWAEENGFFAVRCRDCGLVYVNPRPSLESISLAAQSGLHRGDATVDETGRRDSRKVALYRRRLRALFQSRELAQSARWLDIGCGFGEFLEALALESRGRLSLRGSEPNERKAGAARERGLDVTFRDLDQEHDRYAFVSLLNVFSHLPRPPELLQKLHGLLLPGGELLLQTGNWAELERAAIPDQLHLPDHLSFASEQLVTRLLRQAGFSVKQVLRLPMFRRTLWQRIVAGGTSAPSGPTDLWFRAQAEA